MPPRKGKVIGGSVQGLEQIDPDKIFKPILETAAGVQIIIGVQGKEAEKMHPDAGMTVGQLAVLAEVGTGHVPPRPFLRQFFDTNEAKMAADLQAAMLSVMSGSTSRKKAFEAFGYKWTDKARKFIFDGRVRPKLSAATIRAKGHAIVLVESGTLGNSVTFRLRLQQIRSIQDPAIREAIRNG